ncbi:MAG: hypothetical protein H6765_00365 [Candidatus Peribacteria bacterium]|nr:MAG: hypothetical protein H6765_00365 [Candidatus Peribacteria bacterium]
MNNIVKKPLLYVWLFISSLMALAFIVTTVNNYYAGNSYASSAAFQIQSQTSDTVNFCSRCQEICADTN